MTRNKIYILAVVVPLLTFFIVGLYFNSIIWIQTLMIFTTSYAFLFFLTRIFAAKNPPLDNTDYQPFISIIVPAHNEEAVIADTLKSLLKMDYKKADGSPNFEIIAIDDGSNDDTAVEILQVAHAYPNVKLLKREYPNAKTGKSAALNHALQLCSGELIAVFDADSRIKPNFFNKSVPLFTSDDVVGVQGRVRVYNAKVNFLTLAQEDEFGTYGSIMLGAKDTLGGSCGLGGNGQIVRRWVLDKVDGWNVDSLTEDLDLTIRISNLGLRIRYAPEAIVWQEAVETFEALLRQRKRWTMGFMHATYTYFDSIFHSPMSLFKKTDLYLSLFLALLPIFMIIMYSYYIFTFSFDIFYSTLVSTVYLTLFSIVFYSILFIAFIKVQEERNPLNILMRIVMFGIFNLHWVLVIPVALMEVYRGKKHGQLVWDKTQHTNHQINIPDVK